MFLQGDLKGAAGAFEKVTETDPNNPDGWVNIGRCAVQEGDMDRARTVLEKAIALAPEPGARELLLRQGSSQRRKLRWRGSATANVLAQYPRDRVAMNDLGRVQFLQRKYDEAVKVLNRCWRSIPKTCRRTTT